MAYSLGLVIEGGRGYTTGGYRVFSLNLLSPIDPRGWTSILLPRLPGATPGQYEGYNYLGVGVLVVALIVLVVSVFAETQAAVAERPLGCAAAALLPCAYTPRTFDQDHTWIEDAVGRGSWRKVVSLSRVLAGERTLVLDALLLDPRGCAGCTISVFTKMWANALLACALLLQIADTQSLRHWVRTTISEAHPSPLKSPIWSTLGSVHQNLIVLPAWQCGGAAAPLGPESYRIFGFLAVEQKMRTNSYQSARYTEVARDWHCQSSHYGSLGAATLIGFRVRGNSRTCCSHRARSNWARQVPRS